nr:hypothetical protein [Planococcus faecalis]
MPIPVNHAKPVRVSAKESAYLQLQQWIIDGTLQPEEKLIDTELAQALSLSKLQYAKRCSCWKFKVCRNVSRKSYTRHYY